MIFNPLIPNNSYRTVTESLASTLELLDDRLVFIQEHYSDYKQEDECMPARNEYQHSSETYKRSSFIGVERTWYYRTETWGVKLHTNGGLYIEPCFDAEMSQAFMEVFVQWMMK